ncbi:hypothetical protein TanjilG_06706 [Lupinus angustifolius]|uniref:C2H2-type domain-containing protein n=2 Tax=Lupinus angustifolius TaxID=3871 RepID=A0A1J7HE47_LUPAN|nr:hypothetical protein TanjilG_06706 [Lupinus angustifolius]
MEERKFVCKYCSKRFPCGKSLGGHIRIHMNEHSVQANEERNNAAMLKFDAMRKKKRDSLGYGDGDDGDGADGNLTYGLRENPKKTMRFVHSNGTNNVQQQLDKFCKECGKGFPSLKALCGHMACHSEKEKQKLVLDSESDTETNSAPRRSKRMRFKDNSNNNNNNNHLSSSLANGSSPVSEVEQEQEEVARCLMMLSKDTRYYSGRFGLFAESSDNNSIVVEAKSPSPNTKFTIKNGKNSVPNAYEFVDKKLQNGKKLKSAEIGSDYDNSDSGYFSYGPKKIDSADSNGGFFRTQVQSSKVVDMAGFEDYDVELSKEFSRGRSISTEFKKLVHEDLENGREDGATMRSDSKKRLIYDSLGSKNVANGFNNDEMYKHGRKGLKYESLNTEIQNVYEDDSAYESDENSSDSDSYTAAKSHKIKALNGKKSSKGKNKKKKLKSKKIKEHECPICNRIFKSGQALGGHKRSHFVGGSEENTLVIRPAGAAPAPCLIDLNLPAPVDE